MENKSNSGIFKGTSVLFSIILLIQTLVLIIFMIQLSDSKPFKIAIGFCGTGIAVVSIIMGMITPDDDKVVVKFPWLKYIWLGSLIYTVINLSYCFMNDYQASHSIYESSAYAGSLVLATSLLAFIIVGTRILIKNPAKDAVGMSIARLVLIIFFCWMFLKIYGPIFMGLLSEISGDETFITYASSTEFNEKLLSNLGSVLYWHGAAVAAAICQYRFYHKFLWVASLRKAQQTN